MEGCLTKGRGVYTITVYQIVYSRCSGIGWYLQIHDIDPGQCGRVSTLGDGCGVSRIDGASRQHGRAPEMYIKANLDASL